jgi:hypothetical protein
MNITKSIFASNNKKLSIGLAALLVVSGFFVANSALAASPAPVNLLSIPTNNFVILSETGITNTGSHTSITGNIGSSPITAAAMDNVFCSEITGTIYGVDAAYVGSGSQTCFAPGTTGGIPNADKTLVDQAVLDMGTAYTDAAAGRSGSVLNSVTSAGEIGGQTLAPGVYTFDRANINVNISTNLTLNGGANDVWIFQIPGTFNIASCATCASANDSAGIKVILAGGAQASNVFWQVAGAVTLGTYSTFNGNILAQTNIAIQTGAVLNGRALAQTAVTLDANTVTAPVGGSGGGCGSSSTSTTIYVAPTGLDSNNGSAVCPFLTIQHAINTATSSDTISVAAGTYNESPTISKSVTLKAMAHDGTATSTITGLVTVSSDNVTIDGFEITNPTGAYAVSIPGKSNVTVQNNTIHDVGTSGTVGNVHAVDFQMSSSAGASSLVVSHNTIYNLGNVNDTGSVSAISVLDSTATHNLDGFIADHNTISSVTAKSTKGAYGILLNLGSASKHVADTAAVTGVSITSNDISGLTGGWEHAIGLETNTPSAAVTNNTIHDLTAGSDVEAVHFEKNPGASTVTLTGTTLNSNMLSNSTAAVTVNSAVAPYVVPSTTELNTYPEALSGTVYNYIGLNLFPTIQSGINGVSSRGTINVASGTYNESIAINKPLTIVGVGATKPVITGLAPATNIIEVDTTTGVVLDNLEINGGNSNTFGYGVLVNSAGTSVSPVELKNSTVKNVWGGEASAVEVEGTSYIVAHNNVISLFDKNGIRFVGAQGKFYNNEVIGHGVDGTSQVQNLVNLRAGSDIEVYSNKLHNALTTGTTPTWDSTGVLVSSYDGGASVSPSHANIHNNEIYADDTGIVVGSVYAAGGHNPDAPASGHDTSAATISGNNLHDLVRGINFEQGTVTAAITGNSFSNISGFSVDAHISCISTDTTNPVCNTDTGLPNVSTPSVTASTVTDMTPNYWGQAAGPIAGEIASSITSSFYPWYTDAAMTKLQFTTTASSTATNATTGSSDMTLTGTSTASGNVTVTAGISSGTTVTGNSSWDGVISTPTPPATTVTVTAPDFNTSVTSAFTVGSSVSDLTFDKAVKLTFAGQAGKLVGWYNHAGAFNTITADCAATGGNDQAAQTTQLGAGASCKMDVGSDLVVWTKHFSTFVTYTQTPVSPPPSGGSVSIGVGGGGGGGYSPIPTPTVATTPAATPGQVLGVTAFNFTSSLSLGSSGSNVTELQKRLTQEGFYSGPITGYFGSLTNAAVKAYQLKHSLPGTGFVGSLTRAQLNSPNGGQVAGVSTTSGSDEALRAQIAVLQGKLVTLLQQLAQMLQSQASH